MKARQPICGPKQACASAASAFQRWRWEQEVFIALLLDAKHVPLTTRPIVVAVGSVTSVTVHARDIFREAIRRNATAVIVLHCHPSGDPMPSDDDVRLTARVRTAGDLLGIPVLDSIIATRSGAWFSLMSD